MRTNSPLVVDVHEVLENPGTRRPLSLQARVEGLDVGLVGVPDDIRLDLILEAMDAGTFGAPVRLPASLRRALRAFSSAH